MWTTEISKRLCRVVGLWITPPSSSQCAVFKQDLLHASTFVRRYLGSVHYTLLLIVSTRRWNIHGTRCSAGGQCGGAVKALRWLWFIGSSPNTTCVADLHAVAAGRPDGAISDRRQFHCMPVTQSITKPHHTGRSVGRRAASTWKLLRTRLNDYVTGTPATTKQCRSAPTKIMNFSSLVSNRSISSRRSISLLCQ